jgi:hypothetical protein
LEKAMPGGQGMCFCRKDRQATGQEPKYRLRKFAIRYLSTKSPTVPVGTLIVSMLIRPYTYILEIARLCYFHAANI